MVWPVRSTRSFLRINDTSRRLSSLSVPPPPVGLSMFCSLSLVHPASRAARRKLVHVDKIFIVEYGIIRVCIFCILFFLSLYLSMLD